VLELGGWKGELADLLLPDFPNIEKWMNYEITPQAVSDNTCKDSRYEVQIPDNYLWTLDIDLSKYNVFVASHVIEHLKLVHVKRLLSRLRDIKYLYVDAPLPPNGSMWGGGEFSHIIEIGWTALRDLIESFGFKQVGTAPGVDGSVEWFVRS
jgi:hypothetical protein